MPEGKGETDCVKRITDALATLGHRLVGQADDREDVSPATDPDLNLDGARFDADERER